MAINSVQFERAVYPALRVVIKDAEEALAPEYSVMYNVADSDRAYEEEWTYAGLGAPRSKSEGKPVTFEEMTTGYYTRYNQATYALAARVTLEMRHFEKYGIINELGADMGSSVQEGIEVLCSSILNTAWTTTGADGVVLFSIAHPILKGGTQSNRLSTLSDLTYTSYAQLTTMFETVLSNEGRRRRLTPSILWYHPTLEQKAAELLQSADRPDTANRAKNVLRKVTAVPYHYLSSTSMWGMKAAKDFSRVFFSMRPTTSKAYDFQTDDFMIKTLFMLSLGYTDYRGWFAGHS